MPSLNTRLGRCAFAKLNGKLGQDPWAEDSVPGRRVFMATISRALALQRSSHVWLLIYMLWPFVTACAEYHFDSWTADTGLPQNTVSAVLQTRDGYLLLMIQTVSCGSMAHVSLSSTRTTLQASVATIFPFLTPFYRTWWFAALSILGAVTLAILVWQYRMAEWKRARAAELAFSRQLIVSQESERKRVSAELHDSLGQSLGIIRIRALLALKEPENHRRVLEQLDEIADGLSDALDELRKIAHNLRPYHLERVGLKKSIEIMLDEVSRAEELSVSADIDSIDNLLSPEAQINIYRIVQESTNNIVKHANATEAKVTIRRADAGIEILLQDNGRGFAPDEVLNAEKPHPGLGLIGIAERARIMGGSLTIDSTPGRGTTLKIKVAVTEGV